MTQRCFPVGIPVSVAAIAIILGGCARDGTLAPRYGSIKDPPAVTEGSQPVAPVRARPTRLSERAPRPQDGIDPVRQATAQPQPRSVEAPAPIPAPAVPPAAQPAPPPARTASSQPPVQPQPPARRPQSNGAQLLEEGRLLFRAGEVLAARERYVAALSAPLPEVLLELARTYDPNYLDKLPRTDADADIERARALYEQAVTLGSKAAEVDLARLQGAPSPR